LGTVTFTTGSLLSGSLATNAVFNSGGSFTITGNGTNGVPNGVLFSGSFTSTVTWAYASTLSNGSEVFDISGKVSGGSTIQAYAVVGSNGFTQVYGTLGRHFRIVRNWIGCLGWSGSQKEIIHGKIHAAAVTALTEIAVSCA
jgi:hypothetical protein